MYCHLLEENKTKEMKGRTTTWTKFVIHSCLYTLSVIYRYIILHGYLVHVS